jgi:hypothetical protein
MRIAPAITLTEEQGERLQTCARSRSLPRRVVERAEMILLASEGRQNKAIALTLRRGRSVVARWRQRFIESGLAGIEKMLRDRAESQNSRRRGCAGDRTEDHAEDSSPRHALEHAKYGAGGGSK